ncbi:MAG TPA: DUF4097 family beta strand repeat-containing protein [Vicinamibacterales bacterium]|nr:DUF4097 family beta strand repeat-containing protein [Vicinamibacterales bacterium]
MRASRGILGLALALSLPFAAACDIVGGFESQRETENWSKTYALQAGGRLEVANVNGRIELRGSDTDKVEIRAEKIGKGSTPEGARDMLKRIEIREDVSPDRIRIETRIERTGITRGNGEVRYTISAPAGARVKLETVNGGIEVENVRGGAELDTTNGGIVARRMAGALDAETTNGGIQAELDELAPDGVLMECTNGGLRLTLPRDAKADITARITNGGISVDGLEVERIGEQTRRRLDGRLNGGGPRVRLEGTNGGIRISGK